MEKLVVDVCEEYQNYMKIVAYDCTDDSKVCPESQHNLLPSLVAFVPDGLSFTHVDLGGEVSVKGFRNKLRSLIPFMGTALDNRNIENFLS